MTTEHEHPRPPAARDHAEEQTKVSARWRIVGWIVLTTVITLLAVTVTMRSFLMGQVAESANAAILQELDEFTTFTDEGVDPTTARPFSSMEPLMQRYLSRQTPATGEAIIGVVGQRVMFTDNSRGDAGEDLVNDRPRLDALLSSGRRSGVEETPAGEMRWATISVRPQAGGDPAQLLVVHFTREAREEVNRQVVVLVGIAAGGVLLTAGMAWLAAGRILHPLRAMRDVAELVSARELSARVPVHGRDDLAELGHTLNHMLDRVQHAYASQRHFVLEAQRHLGAPLRRADRAVQRATAEDAGPAQRREAGAEAIRHLTAMRTCLADLELLAEGDQPGFVTVRPVDAAELTERFFARASRAHPGQRWVFDGAAAGTAQLDPHRVEAALHQLVRNAVEHSTENGPVHVGSAFVPPPENAPENSLQNSPENTPKTTPETTPEDATWLSVWVTNYGRPLDPKHARKLFELYRSNARDEDETGMGLGLAVVRAVADAHGGSAWVESTEDGGTRFGIDLPRWAPAAPEAAQDVTPNEGHHAVRDATHGVRRDGADHD